MVVICKYCNKEYSSYSSRSNHIKKYHSNPEVIKSNPTSHPKVIQSHPINENKKKFACKFCNKTFKYRQGKWKHEQKCEDTNIIKKENEEMKTFILNQKMEMDKLKNELLKALKIHPKTLQKINNQLNNNNINNGTINNINIIPLGHENLDSILSDKEKLRILNRRGNGLKEIVELVHISDKYNQFKNVYITNLQNTIGYKFDTKTNNFIAVNKSDLLDDIIECRMMDIETFYNDMEDKLDEDTIEIVQRFIERMNDNNDNLKGIKKEEIKLLLYNSREKIQAVNQLEI